MGQQVEPPKTFKRNAEYAELIFIRLKFKASKATHITEDPLSIDRVAI